MKNIQFKPVMLLAIFLPLLLSYAGYLLYNPSQSTVRQPVESTIEQGTSTTEPVLINKSDTATPAKTEEDFGFKQLYIYVALLAGVFALLFYYLKTSLGWLAVILLPLGFALIFRNETGMTLTAFYLPNVVFAAAFALMIRYLFFVKTLLRFRMIVSSIVGAGLLTFYLRSLYLLAKAYFNPLNWSLIFVSAMILMVFITFGMSVADMLIRRSELKNEHLAPEPDIDYKEDEDINA